MAFALLELDGLYSAFTSAAQRSPQSFRANSQQSTSSLFLTFADVSGASEGGAVTEFVQWRRRSCELRARGWGLAIQPAAMEGREGAAAELSPAPSPSPASAPPPPWRLSSFNPVAREQAAKNFSAFPPSTSTAAFVARVRVDTAGQGVAVVVGAAPALHWTEDSGGGAPRPPLLRPLLEDLAVALTAAFGVLRPGGDLVYRLSGLGCPALQRSPLLLSSLHLLTAAFTEVRLHRTAARRWGEGEGWLVAQHFRLSQRPSDAAAAPAAAALYADLSRLLPRALESSGADGELGECSLGVGWQEDGVFLQSARAAFDAVLRGEEADLLRLALQPCAGVDRIAPFASPSAEAGEQRREALLARGGLSTADGRSAPHTA